MNKVCSNCRRLFTMTMDNCPFCTYHNEPHELMKSNKGITMGLIGAGILISIMTYVIYLGLK